jgi:hypothetical protein
MSNTYRDYKSKLNAFMSWKDGRAYGKDAVFPERELRQITPNDICRYFKHLAYGDPDCDERGTNPTSARHNSLQYHKKAISQCLPNAHMPWNDHAMIGNPTKSAVVNKLLRIIRKKEVSGLGVPSSARRALTDSEFECMMDIIESRMTDDTENMVFLSAFFKYQYNMIARVDDTAKLRCNTLQVLNQYPDFGILTRLNWGKNVMEERDAPNQILFGSFDCRYCPLIGLGTWLELYITIHPEPNEFVFGIHGKHSPEYIKAHASYEFNRIIKRNDFERSAVSGNIGTHSLRKFAATKARSNGCSKDDTDYRARWKGEKRQQDTYANVTIPYIDAKSAAALCKGGPCTYSIKSNSGITNDWILDYVVPNIRNNFDRQIAIVLGKAVTWKIFSNFNSGVPNLIRNRVLEHYQDVVHGPDFEIESNPIEKLALGVDGSDAELMLDVLFMDDDVATPHPDSGDNGRSTETRASMRSLQRQEILLLRSQILHLREENRNLMKELERRDAKIMQQLRFINFYVRRSANAPGRPTQQQLQAANSQEESRNNQEAEVVEEGRVTAVLMKHPRTLHDLWREYEFGAPGHKPAKDFTAAERGGKNKHSFYLRKFFWKKVAEMIRSGLDANDACDRIYNVYGNNLSVSTILRKLQSDSKTGGHPNLRITNT